MLVVEVLQGAYLIVKGGSWSRSAWKTLLSSALGSPRTEEQDEILGWWCLPCEQAPVTKAGCLKTFCAFSQTAVSELSGWPLSCTLPYLESTSPDLSPGLVLQTNGQSTTHGTAELLMSIWGCTCWGPNMVWACCCQRLCPAVLAGHRGQCHIGAAVSAIPSVTTGPAPQQCPSPLSQQGRAGLHAPQRPVLPSISDSFNKHNTDTIARAPRILPSQNWHQLPTVMVAHLRSVLVPENEW